MTALKVILLAAAIGMAALPAQAQTINGVPLNQTYTFTDPAGGRLGSATTDSAGNLYFYGPEGSGQGKAVRNGFGGYQYYGPDGRYLGQSYR